MSTTKPLTICPLPTPETLEAIRDRTSDNDHDGARVLALQELVRLFDAHMRTVCGPGAAVPNPFRPLLAAASELAAEQERAGFVSDPLLVVRAGLWRVAGTVAEHCGPALAPAWQKLNACL